MSDLPCLGSRLASKSGLKIGLVYFVVCSKLVSKIGLVYLVVCSKLVSKIGLVYLVVCSKLVSKIGLVYLVVCSKLVSQIGLVCLVVCSKLFSQIGLVYLVPIKEGSFFSSCFVVLRSPDPHQCPLAFLVPLEILQWSWVPPSGFVIFRDP